MKVEVNNCWHIKQQGKGQARAFSRALWTSKNTLGFSLHTLKYSYRFKDPSQGKWFFFFFNNQHVFHFHLYSHVLWKASGFLLASVFTYQFHSVASIFALVLGSLISSEQTGEQKTVFHLAHSPTLCIVDMAVFNNNSCWFCCGKTYSSQAD